MLNRTLFLLVIGLVVTLSNSGASALRANSGTQDAAAKRTSIILGQNDSRNNNNGGVGNWFRQTFNRLLPDDSQDQRRETRPAVAAPPATPISPPRPLTGDEIQEMLNPVPSQPPRSSPNTSPGMAGSTTPQGRTNQSSAQRQIIDDRLDPAEASTLERMRILRSPVFENNPALEEAARASRSSSAATSSRSSPALSPSGTQDMSGTPRSAPGEVNEFGDATSFYRSPAVVEGMQTTSASRGFESRAGDIRRDEFAAASQQYGQSTAGNQLTPHASPFTEQQNFPSQQTQFPTPNREHAREMHTSQGPVRSGMRDREDGLSGNTLTHNAAQDNAQRLAQASRLMSASPQLLIEVEKPSSVTVNQEIAYRIRVTNVGEVQADGVLISTDVPSWIDVPDRQASTGDVKLFPRDDSSGTVTIEWRINRINPGSTELLVLRVIPRLHQSIELHIRHDFVRPAIVIKADVREPKLEMELLGADEVLWNDIVNYRLLVRNVGNGDAENVKLSLRQSSSAEDSACEFAEPLRPGETQELDIKVQAGREREHIDIVVLAEGSHNVRAEVSRRLRVLRPRLEMSVQTLPLHFVENSAEVMVRLWNVGTADAANVTVRAELPLGTDYDSSNENGVFFVQQQQNIVEWRGKHIARGEILTLTLNLIPRREGQCRVSVDTIDPNGNILVAGNGTFMAEAVVDLNLEVTAPRGPIELGENVVYEIQVVNAGTKAAENVEILMTLGHLLEPTGVSGGDANSTDDGLVSFEKIPLILPKQSVTVGVIVRANGIGTAPIRAEVIRSDSSGTPVRLEKGLSAYIVSRQTPAVSQQPHHEVFR